MTKKSKKSKEQSEFSAKHDKTSVKREPTEEVWAASYRQLVNDYDEVFKKLAK